MMQMTDKQSKVWFVTGSANGLGRDIVEAALAAGDSVFATARDPGELADLKAQHGDRIATGRLDVADAVEAAGAIEQAVRHFGRLDVIVNNAGFGHIVPFEQMTEADFRSQIDTNFYGVVNVTRAALPHLRKQRSGHIIQISSVGGRIANPGLSAYQAAKWAVGGFSEVVAQEVGALGIRVTVLEPGGMRTNWGHRAGSEQPELWDDYKPVMNALFAMLADHIGHEASDPRRVATLTVALANAPQPPLRLLLGSDALQFFGMVDETRRTADARWLDVSRFTDHDNPASAPALPAA
jgi:NAD(P)-dependent dehydrogenase (short-subunit alcohol dehydrogenase family)